MNSKFEQDLLDDIMLWQETYAETYTKEGAKRLTDAAYRFSIKLFYDDYKPKQYRRTNNFAKNAARRYWKKVGNYYYGGVKISTEKMHEYKQTKPEKQKEGKIYFTLDQIFANNFFRGVHGNESVKVMKKSPYKLIKDYYDSGKEQVYAQKKAEEKAKKQNYKILKF